MTDLTQHVSQACLIKNRPGPVGFRCNLLPCSQSGMLLYVFIEAGIAVGTNRTLTQPCCAIIKSAIGGLSLHSINSGPMFPHVLWLGTRPLWNLALPPGPLGDSVSSSGSSCVVGDMQDPEIPVHPHPVGANVTCLTGPLEITQLFQNVMR